MKYRIEGPAYLGAPQEWDIVNDETDERVCRCYTEKQAEMVRDCFEAK